MNHFHISFHGSSSLSLTLGVIFIVSVSTFFPAHQAGQKAQTFRQLNHCKITVKLAEEKQLCDLEQKSPSPQQATFYFVCIPC